jgi:hypothetical protein
MKIEIQEIKKPSFDTIERSAFATTKFLSKELNIEIHHNEDDSCPVCELSNFLTFEWQGEFQK